MSECNWFEDVTDPTAVEFLLEGNLVIRWRVIRDFPEWFWVTYIGPLIEP